MKLATANDEWSALSPRVDKFRTSLLSFDQSKRHFDSPLEYVPDVLVEERNAFWQSLAGDIQRERERFEDSFTNLIQELGPRDGFSPGATIPRFLEFWDEHKNRVAQTFVESIGQDVSQRDLWQLCADRGIGGLFNVRCVRLAVGATIALMYSHFYNEGRPLSRQRGAAVAEPDRLQPREFVPAPSAAYGGRHLVAD
jgi:hypothetical protein